MSLAQGLAQAQERGLVLHLGPVLQQGSQFDLADLVAAAVVGDPVAEDWFDPEVELGVEPPEVGPEVGPEVEPVAEPGVAVEIEAEAEGLAEMENLAVQLVGLVVAELLAAAECSGQEQAFGRPDHP